MTKPISINNEDVFMRLWVNECMHVFYDRLINDEDREWLQNLITELLAKNFKMAPEKEELFSKLKFGDLLKLESS
jgi:dynein heavy chain